MKLISRLSLAALLPIVVWLAACSPGATSAPASATTAPAVATTATAAASIAPTVAAPAAPANTIAPINTAAPTLTIAPVAIATRAAATPGITPTGAVISGTGGTSVSALTIKGFIFKPEVLQIKVGTTVTWTNMDDIPHSVTHGTPPTPGGAFDTGFFTQGQSVSLTFTQPGEYPYFCKRHNSMTSMVKVVP